MGSSNGALPKVIHIDIATTECKKEQQQQQQQTMIEMERKIVLRTPPPSSTRGILKPSSYHRKNSCGSLNRKNSSGSLNINSNAIPALMLSPYTNANANANANANTAKPNASTPSTVGTNESSLDSCVINCKDHDDDIHDITQSPDNSLDRIICNLDSSITNNANHSPQRPSSVLLSSSSSSSFYTGSEREIYDYEEERLRTRHARIKHIEDLNERIKAAKARKIVERKAYRREDKLLLRLARELKTTSKQVSETAWKVQQVSTEVLCIVFCVLCGFDCFAM